MMIINTILIMILFLINTIMMMMTMMMMMAIIITIIIIIIIIIVTITICVADPHAKNHALGVGCVRCGYFWFRFGEYLLSHFATCVCLPVCLPARYAGM